MIREYIAARNPRSLRGLVRMCREAWDTITLTTIRTFYHRWESRLERVLKVNGHVVNMKKGCEFVELDF